MRGLSPNLGNFLFGGLFELTEVLKITCLWTNGIFFPECTKWTYAACRRHAESYPTTLPLSSDATLQSAARRKAPHIPLRHGHHL
jgi:hypothetical protein